jgi:hypothetical protein
MKVELVAIVLCITVLSIPLGCTNVMEEHKR